MSEFEPQDTTFNNLNIEQVSENNTQLEINIPNNLIANSITNTENELISINDKNNEQSINNKSNINNENINNENINNYNDINPEKEFYKTERNSNKFFNSFNKDKILDINYKDDSILKDNERFYQSESRIKTNNKEKSRTSSNKKLLNELDRNNINENIKMNFKNYENEIPEVKPNIIYKDKRQDKQNVEYKGNNKKEEIIVNLPNINIVNNNNYIEKNLRKKTFIKNKRKRGKKKCCHCICNKRCLATCCGSRGFLCALIFFVFGFIIVFIIVKLID